jgi:hypothetical protein
MLTWQGEQIAMDRRKFLKVSGMMAAGPAVRGVPFIGLPGAQLGLASPGHGEQGAAQAFVAPLAIQEAGTYRISGTVRLDAPLVEISGITHKQWISWSDTQSSETPRASFVSFEHFDGSDSQPQIRVLGGQLESLSIVPLE